MMKFKRWKKMIVMLIVATMFLQSVVVYADDGTLTPVVETKTEAQTAADDASTTEESDMPTSDVTPTTTLGETPTEEPGATPTITPGETLTTTPGETPAKAPGTITSDEETSNELTKEVDKSEEEIDEELLETESVNGEVPEEVQAFLDAVAALPSADEVTAENAEEIGEQVNAVLDMWDAMSVENGERDDVQAALENVYAVYEAVLAIEEIEASNYWIPSNQQVHTVYVPSTNLEEDQAELEFVMSYSDEPLPVATPTVSFNSDVATVTATATDLDYSWNPAATTKIVVKVIGKKATGNEPVIAKVQYKYQWPTFNIYGYQTGWQAILQTETIRIYVYDVSDATEIEPGEEKNIRLKCTPDPYDGFEQSEFWTNKGISARRNGNNVTVTAGSEEKENLKLHMRYGYYTSITNGGQITQYVDVRKFTVKKAAPTAPEREDLYGILGNFVKVQCVSEGDGLPHSEKTYCTNSYYNKDGKYESSVGEVYKDEATGKYKVDVTLNGDVYADLYGSEPSIGTGVSHTLKTSEAATQTVTLTWDTVNSKWVGPQRKGTVLATFKVVCKKSITNFTKELVKSAKDVPAGVSVDGITYPGSDGKVTIPESGSVTLLYKITVTGEAGATYKVVDNGATWVSGPTLNEEHTIPEGGTKAVIYVKKTFTKDDVNSAGNLTNTAIITPGTGTNPNSSATESTPVKDADLEVEKTRTSAKDKVEAGDTITWDIKITNNSYKDKKVKVQDILKIDGKETAKAVTVTSADGNTPYTKDTELTIAKGKSVTLKASYVVQPDDAGKKITNKVEVTEKKDDGSDGPTVSGEDDKGATVDDTTTLEIQKTVQDKDGNTITTAKAGDTVKYVITVKNTGKISAENVSVKDQLDTEKLTFDSATLKVGTGEEKNVTPIDGGVYTIGELAVGTTAVLTITAKVKANILVGVEISNTATVDSDNLPTDTPKGEKEDTADITVSGEHFEVKKELVSPSTEKVEVGETITWNITIKNLTNQDRIVNVKDILSVGGSEKADAVVTVKNGNEVITESRDLSVSAGTTVTLTASYKVMPGDAGKKITNKVEVKEKNDTGEPTVGEDTTGKDVDNMTDLSVVKEAKKDAAGLEAAGNPKAGDEFFYQITVTNTGKVTAEDVKVTDKLDSRLDWQSASLKVGDADETDIGPDSNDVYTIGAIPAGKVAVLTIKVKVKEGTTVGAEIPNTAEAAGTNTRKTVDNEDPSDTVTITVGGNALDVSKQRNGSGTAIVGESSGTITWDIVLTNNTSSDIKVKVEDILSYKEGGSPTDSATLTLDETEITADDEVTVPAAENGNAGRVTIKASYVTTPDDAGKTIQNGVDVTDPDDNKLGEADDGDGTEVERAERNVTVRYTYTDESGTTIILEEIPKTKPDGSSFRDGDTYDTKEWVKIGDDYVSTEHHYIVEEVNDLSNGEVNGKDVIIIVVCTVDDISPDDPEGNDKQGDGIPDKYQAVVTYGCLTLLY